MQAGSVVHQAKLVYPNLCQQVADQVHFSKSSKRTFRKIANRANQAEINNTLDIKRVQQEIYDLCLRRFREVAVEPIQHYCRTIKNQVVKPSARFLPLLIIPVAAGVSLGIGIIGGVLISKKGLADQRKEFDTRINNVSTTINDNQATITEKLAKLEELLNIYQATVIAQAENHFLPQVVGEVFTTAAELVKEGEFHQRILAYAPGAIPDPENYDLRHVKYLDCQELPLDENLITINVTMILPVVDRQVSISERKWLPYSQDEWLVTAEGSPYIMTVGNQQIADSNVT